MIRGLLIIFSLLLLPEAICNLLSLDFPPSVIGMILLATALHFNIINTSSIKPVADVLLTNLGLFFVPSGVGLIAYFDLIKSNFFAIVIATTVSTFLVILIVGILTQLLIKE